MSPQDRREFEELKKLVHAMREADDIRFVEQIKRRGISQELARQLNTVRLGDLADVNVSGGVSTGQVLKYNEGTASWTPSADLT